MEILRLTSRESIAPQPVSQLQPQSPDIHLDLEDLYLILQIEPNDSLIAMELARRLNASGQSDEAARILREVVSIDYRFETLSALGHAEYESGELDEAFDHLQQAVMVAPEESTLLFDVFKTIGNIFVRRGDFDSAEDSYNKAHRMNPSSDILHVNLGTLAVQRGNWDEAVEKFRFALSLNPANDKAWVGLAIGHRMKCDPELAWGNLENALDYNPLNETALTLALDWGLQEHRDLRVLEMLRTFLVEGGWSEKLSLAFAYLSHRCGGRFAARLEVERLLAVNPTHPGALQLVDEMRSARD